MQDFVSDSKKFWGMHRYLLMLIISISIAFSLLAVSLSLYISSGTIQLDLSRPGYQSVSNQTDATNLQIEKFPETGAIDKVSLDDFDKLITNQSTKANAVDAFGGDPLDPVSIGIYQQN
jgi:hypothetical protein